MESRKHYIIYCDESVERGRYFSNFYAGALISAARRQFVESALIETKERENIFGEVKWTKIGEAYEKKYVVFIEKFFDLVQSGDIKVRVMFTHNIHTATNLTAEHVENAYFLLYYQFLKHAFGLRYSNSARDGNKVFSVYLDNVPQTKEKFETFRAFLSKLSNMPEFYRNGIVIPHSEIVSVDSKERVILQAVDVVLGAMQFRLNEKHKDKPPGAKARGKRTVSKERVYKRINQLIRQIHPGFNIGISTGQPEGPHARWEGRYRHWRFVPADNELDLSKSKKK